MEQNRAEIPIKLMLLFQSVPLHVSQSPQYGSLPSSFPSQNLYKGRGAPFPKPIPCTESILIFIKVENMDK
jgi:hypothetical protein